MTDLQNQIKAAEAEYIRIDALTESIRRDYAHLKDRCVASHVINGLEAERYAALTYLTNLEAELEHPMIPGALSEPQERWIWGTIAGVCACWALIIVAVRVWA